MYMEKCQFDEVNLNGSSFQNLSMNEAGIGNSSMSRAQFTSTALNECNFDNSTFSGSKFVRTDFSGVMIDESCDISGMTINGISVEALLKSYNDKENNGGQD